MYIELHSRSTFSFLEGSSLPESLITRCAERQMPAMALLDRDGVYGAPRFHMAARKAGIKAHIGAEVTYDFSCSATDLAGPGKTLQATSLKTGSGNFRLRLPLLISSRTGYQNLCRLITKMKLRNNKDEGAVFEHELQEHAEGFICLTGGEDGPLANALRNGNMDAVRDSVE